MSHKTRHRDETSHIVLGDQNCPNAERELPPRALALDPSVTAWNQMLEAIQEGLLCFTSEGECVFASPTARHLLSADQDSLDQIALCSLLPEWQAQDADERAKPQQILWKCPRETRWLEARFLPCTSGVALHLRDITTAKENAEKLRHSEARFKAVISHLPVGFILGNETQAVARINDEFHRMFQLSGTPDDWVEKECLALAQNISTLFEDPEKFLRQIQEIITQAQPVHAARTQTREQRHLEFDYIPIFDNGEDLGHLCLFSDISERVRTTAALRESEERFRAICDAAPLGVFVEDMVGDCRYVNPEYSRLVGYPASEMLGRGWMERIHRDDLDRLHYEWQAAREHMVADPAYVFEFPHRGTLPDGSIRHCHIRVTGLRNEVGGIIGYVGTLEDITERLHREDILREREERLRAISESSPLGIYVEDTEGNCLYVNPAYERIIGYPFAEVVGQGWQNLIIKEDMLRLQRLWPEARQKMATNPHYVYECSYRVALPQGKYRWCQTRIASMRDSRGALTGFVGAVEDATQRREAEVAVRESEERYRALVEATSDCVWRISGSGTLLEVNRGLRAVPLSKRTMDPTAILALIHPRDKKNVIVQWYHSLATGEIMEQEFRIKGKRGAWVSVFARAVALRDAEGNIREWVGTATDTTAKRQAEAERERLMQEALARAERDPLSDLYNHRAFHQRLSQLGNRMHETNGMLVVAVLDMDSFKYFNDVYGHLVGDDVLMTVSQMLRKLCREGDVIARLGGDEFALLLPRSTEEDARAIISQLRESAQALPYQPPGEPYPLPIRLSVGTAVYPLEGVLPVEAFTLADRRALLDKGGERYAPAREIAEHLKRTVEGFDMLDALVSSVDNKDRYTRRHSEDVLIYSQWIAEELGLSDEAITSLQVAALIHDVGKIGVPDRILRLPGRLTEADYGIMKRHVVLGGLLVSAVPGLEGTLGAVRHHHERWDGDGYPDRLRAEAIPYTARLMAVADAFSAMTTDRPYRKGLPHPAALSVLRQGAGTQWDTTMVAAMANALAARGHLLNQQ